MAFVIATGYVVSVRSDASSTWATHLEQVNSPLCVVTDWIEQQTEVEDGRRVVSNLERTGGD